MKRRWLVGLIAGIIGLGLLMVSGCGGSDPATPENSASGHPATRAEMIGDGEWLLAVFWSSDQGTVTQQEYFDQPALDRVTASFRADGTFSMVLLDENENRLGTVEGTWEMPRTGELIIHWPDRSVTYEVRWAQGWVWTRSGEMGVEIRLYFK